jgi:formylglycine-generating enzyme required for sulfatase activity
MGNNPIQDASISVRFPPAGAFSAFAAEESWYSHLPKPDKVIQCLYSQFRDHPNLPVESVSWDDVQAFLHKLNAREGRGDYRLPTEAQWEYACRAGTETPRYHPDVNAIAWYHGNSNGDPQPVGQKLPNAWGFYDMLGSRWREIRACNDNAY